MSSHRAVYYCAMCANCENFFIRTHRLISRNGDHQWPPKSCDLTLLVYVNKPREIIDLKEEIRRVFTQSYRISRTEFLHTSAAYARHHFAYLKWEGKLNMFMSFLVLFLHFRRKTRLIKWASVCVCLCTVLVPH